MLRERVRIFLKERIDPSPHLKEQSSGTHSGAPGSMFLDYNGRGMTSRIHILGG